MLLKFFAAFAGLAEGFSVGTAMIAFLTILDIVPRLAQLTNTESYIRVYEITIVMTTTILSLVAFLGFNIYVGKIMIICIGFLMGTFIGLLASALTEVTNVIPVIVNRFQLNDYVKYILIAIAGGKITGSLIYWIFVNK
ncbi:stage V sporulation protein AC [Crassaminicella thermophila]|uniref:Stage V sporulation protein AC n=1 Tax=Crassaminicella thermophila TaxID=2599308 RepID=A0A5C0SFE1_CRATE|nr:stage V sporulation protein AB [Crassaminicella thermophila]QEK12457.1 stage V sporulation protein AC [Crassaminicella thermophila]